MDELHREWLPRVYEYVDRLAAIGADHLQANPWTRCNVLSQCQTQMAIVEAAWGACTVPPYIVLAEWQHPDDWYHRYQPVITAFVDACDRTRPPLLTIPVTLTAVCGGGDTSHQILLMIDRGQRVQTIFDPRANQTEPMSPFQEFVVSTLALRPLVGGYTGVIGRPVMAMQDVYEYAPACAASRNDSEGCCTVMYLLIACVCHRFQFRNVTFAADLLVDVAKKHDPDVWRLREHLWGWQARITAFAEHPEAVSVTELRAVVGLSAHSSTRPCAVEGDDHGGPCRNPGGWDGTDYCGYHGEQLLPPTTDAELQRRLRWFQLQWDKQHMREILLEVYEWPAMVHAIVGHDDVATAYWNGHAANPPVMVRRAGWCSSCTASRHRARRGRRWPRRVPRRPPSPCA